MEETNITSKDNPHLYNESRTIGEKGYLADTHLINGTKLGFRLKSYFKSIVMLFALLFICLNVSAKSMAIDAGALISDNIKINCDSVQQYGFIEIEFPFYQYDKNVLRHDRALSQEQNGNISHISLINPVDDTELKIAEFRSWTNSDNYQNEEDNVSTYWIDLKALSDIYICGYDNSGNPVRITTDGYKRIEKTYDKNISYITLRVYLNQEYLNKTYKVKVALYVDQLNDGKGPEFQTNVATFTTDFNSEINHSFIDVPGKLTYNFTANGKNSGVFRIMERLGNEEPFFEEKFSYSINLWNEPIHDKASLIYLLGKYPAYPYDNRVTYYYGKEYDVPAYKWPKTLDLDYNETKGIIKLSWNTGSYTGDDCIKGDQFEIQRATNKLFTEGLETIKEIDFAYDKNNYFFEDDISDLNLSEVYYRLRRTYTKDNWGWDYAITNGVSVNSSLPEIIPDSIKINTTDKPYPISELYWTYKNGFWPNGTVLKVIAKNLTTKQTTVLAELNQRDTKLGEYIDDSVIPCNEISYSLQLIPGSDSYPQPDAIEFSQTVLVQDIGTISDLKASKGYFSDRVDLEWNALGNFDSYRIRRVEYGKSNSDTILVGNVNAVGGDKMITEDTKGSPGVYYTYLVEGIVSCSGKKMYTPLLTDIGFRSPTGSIYGRITYENGQAVPNADVLLDSDEPESGRSMLFNGSNQYLQIKNDVELGPNFTIQAYIAPQSIVEGVVISKEDQYEIGFANGYIYFSAGNVRVMDNKTFNSSGFTHITAKCDNDNLMLYLNGELVAEKSGYKFEVDTIKNPIYIGKNVSGKYFKGNIDEFRIWNIALDSTLIARDYTRLLYGGETGLAAYWRFDDGIENEFYDISYAGNNYNNNHGEIVGAIYDTKIPEMEQLALKGITDERGNYTISGIPYSGQGTMYRVIPRHMTHQFDPSEQQRLIGNGALSHTCNFTDVSSFPVSGYVYYSNSTIPVKDVSFEVDGLIASVSNKPVYTDEQGKFLINVPVGVHEVKAIKANHVFENEGRITNIDGSDRNYQGRIENIHLYDSTTVKFIGRVSGGAIEDSYPLGHSLSKNILGETTTITMNLTGGLSANIINSKSDSIVVQNHMIPSNMEGSKPHRTKVTYKKDQIIIMPDSITGEFEVMLVPENFTVTSVAVVGHNNIIDRSIAIDLTQKYFEQESINDYTDSVAVAGKLDTWIYTDYSDTVRYHDSYKFIKRVNPNISVEQLIRNRPINYYGNDTINLNNGSGIIIPVPVVDSNNNYTFGVPVFAQNEKYNFLIKAFEAYDYYDKDGNITKTSNIPTQDGIVNINNQIADTVEPDTVSIQSDGTATYSFIGGDPELTVGTKTINVSLKVDNTVIPWGKTITGYVIGGKSTGNNFVTAGPDLISAVLRDPPGSLSYSYLEEGTTFTRESTYVGGVKLEESGGGASVTGAVLVMVNGMGSAVQTESRVDMEDKYMAIFKQTVAGERGTTTTMTTTNRWSTSDSPAYVGADADVYIGYSTNIIVGTVNSISIKEKKYYDSTSDILLAENGDYCIVRCYALGMGVQFATAFAYPQIHIENVLIPMLKDIRKSKLLLPSMYTKDEAQELADRTFDQVYLSKLEPDHKYFGLLNTDNAFGANKSADYDYDDGPSYTIYYPKKNKKGDPFVEATDTILTINQSINRWIEVMAANEKAKVNAAKIENLSFHAASPIERSYQNSVTSHEQQTFEFVVGSSQEIEGNVLFNRVGVKTFLNLKETTSHGGRFVQDDTETSTFGFVLKEEVSDYLSVDLKEYNNNYNYSQDSINANGYVFVTQGGVTSCPYEGGYVTKYYKKGTRIDYPTTRVEVPVLAVENPEVLNVPSSRRATFKLLLRNESEVQGESVMFGLKLIESSNPNGAGLYIDGAALGNGRSFVVPYGETLVKTLEVSKGTELNYENLQLVLHSQCQYNPMDSQENIGDTVSISVTFIPSCSDIHIKSPTDKWTLNSNESNIDAEGNYFMNIVLDNYDVNYENFDHIAIMYKPSAASDASWVTVCNFYADTDKYDAAEGAKEMIEGAIISYNLIMNNFNFPDQNYDICAVSYCKIVNDLVETQSNIVSGIKDTYKPRLFGSAQPANGILGIDDEVRLNFNEKIAEGYLSDNNFEVTGIRNGEILSRSASVRFDGINDYLVTEIEKNFSGKSFTVETSLYLDELKHESTIFSQGNVNNSFEISITTDKKLKVKVGSTVITTDSPLDLQEGVWEHVAVIYTYGTTPNITAYYNKVQVLNKAVSAYSGIGNYEIGRSISNNSNYFCGKLCELRVWDKALSLGVINKNKDISLKGNEVSLISYYPMNAGRGSLVLDKARGANALMKDAEWFINRSGYAAQFTGNSYLKLSTGSIPISSDVDFTIEFWFKGEPGQSNVALVSNGRGDNAEEGGSADKLFIGFDGTGKLCLISNGHTETIGNDNYLDNTWYHYALAVSRNIGRASIYIDGDLKTYFDANALENIQSAFTYLGARGWYKPGDVLNENVDQFFKGNIDEFRIWKTYKTETLIVEENNINLEGKEMGLLTYYPFEDYMSHQGTQEMVFTVADKKYRTDNDPIIPDAENMNVVKTDDTAPVKERGATIPIQINYVVNNDALIITPYASSGWDDFEQSIVTFKVDDVRDVNGNSIANPIVWSAYIDRNQLIWNDDELNITKMVYDEYEVQVSITNQGGTVQRYSIENNPSWLTITPNSGTINPKSTVHLTFKVDEALNIGSYTEVIYLMNENSVGRPLDLNVKVKGEKPNWSVNPSDFNYNMSIYGKLRFNNIFSADKEDMIAAFKDGKCIGVTNSKYFEDVDMWYAFLTIYSNDTMQDGIEFRLWDDSTGKIYLADSSIGDISFVSNAIIGTPDVPIIFDGEELMFQNILLNRGWNWLSFNLESNNLNNVTATLANGSWTNNDEVKNDNSTASYSENEKCWIGSLSSGDGFNNLSMYMLNSSYDQVLSVSGTAIDGLDTPISITPQWNYIGYLPQVNMTVKEALADYKAMPGDVLKSQTSFTMYSDNNGWIGNLTYMEANKGYMLFRKADAGTTSFRYPSTLGSMTAATRITGYNVMDQSRMAQDVATQYPDNMTMIAIPSGFELESNDRILAYASGELRGIGNEVILSSDGTPVLFVTVSGNNDTPINILIERDGDVVAAANQPLSYATNAIQGTLNQPLLLDFSSMEDGINVYPTQFDSYVNVSIINANANNVQINLYDMSGRLMMNQSNNISNGIYQTSIDGSSLASGVYVLAVKVNGETTSFKIEKK